MLGSADTARRGNMVSALGMLLAVVVTLFQTGMDFTLIGIRLGVGAVIGHLVEGGQNDGNARTGCFV